MISIAFWVGLVAAILALWFSGLFDEAWEGFRGARLIPLIAVVLVGMALPIVHAFRWMVVMRSLGFEIRAVEAADITVSSALLNYASPGFVGASAKAILANRSTAVPMRQSALSIGFEHSLDLFLMVTTSSIAILILGPSRFRGAVRPVEDQVSVLTVIITVGVIAILTTAVLKFNLLAYFRQLLHTIETLGRKVDGRAVVLLTFAYWFLQVMVVGLLFWSLNLTLSLLDIFAIATVPTLAGMLAPVPGGVGVREAMIVALTTVTEIGAGTLLTLAILQRVLLVASLPLSLAVLRIVRRMIPDTE
ncbi:MAG: lysylphosphatidylglycerol synthase transmembrane domain-containing protein [Chloroflexota bacterium]